MLPNIPSPTLSDLHVSLANHERLAYFIDMEKKRLYPAGTDWEGVKRYKEVEDLHSLPDDLYICKIIELLSGSLSVHIEDEPMKKGQTEGIQMSDIGFKRVVGFYEFELACLDRDANTSMIFCRVFLNRQSAAAHERLFHEIKDIVKIDTGRALQWHHLHGDSVDETEGMILQFAADQHAGQAKDQSHHSQLVAEDTKIAAHNARIDKARTSLTKATTEIARLNHQLRYLDRVLQTVQHQRLAAALERAQKLKESAQMKYDKEVAGVAVLRETGSGRVVLLTL
ncbi:hypothetical protein C0992_007001 [Termitomyces sp. T32_za158]|nr:hypothetical protein C0992_007001 [Termitomyces sp. T32_za158]